jgi:hypothetical protein
MRAAHDMTRRRPATTLAALLLAAAALLPHPARAGEDAPAEPGVLVEARFVDPASGLEAEWGATGQILVAPQAGDPALAHWRGARALATSPSRQSVTLAPGGRATIRVGREIPFSGWFLRLGRQAGQVEPGAEWREVESTFEVELAAAGTDGSVRLLLTPELAYLQGRTRRSVAFHDLRAEVLLGAGREARLAPAPTQGEFYRRFLAGYDPLRRVRGVDLLLRAVPPPPAPPAP